MYHLDQSVKRDPVRRWALPDRIFFGHGACHILAGTYLLMEPLSGFHAEKITPADGFWGNHVYVTDGTIAFDYHGYSTRDRLLRHIWHSWTAEYPGWSAQTAPVDFDLLDTTSLNARKMLGPDQYLHDAVARARSFIATRDHLRAAARARQLARTGCQVLALPEH